MENAVLQYSTIKYRVGFTPQVNHLLFIIYGKYHRKLTGLHKQQIETII